MIIIALALSLNVSAQWTNKSVNNGFDDPYRICYTAENNGAILGSENQVNSYRYNFSIKSIQFCKTIFYRIIYKLFR